MGGGRHPAACFLRSFLVLCADPGVDHGLGMRQADEPGFVEAAGRCTIRRMCPEPVCRIRSAAVPRRFDAPTSAWPCPSVRGRCLSAGRPRRAQTSSRIRVRVMTTDAVAGDDSHRFVPGVSFSNRAFSLSRVFRRLASDTSLPPHSLRHGRARYTGSARSQAEQPSPALLPISRGKHPHHLAEGAGKGGHRLVTAGIGRFGDRSALLQQAAGLAHTQGQQHMAG